MADKTSKTNTIGVSRNKIKSLLDEVLNLKKDNAEDKDLLMHARRKLLKIK